MNRSTNRSLDNIDNWAVNFSQDHIDKFCDSVRHILDDHLELHGIKRGTLGISGAVLQDKLKLMNHEQSQLKAKYLNYAEIRKVGLLMAARRISRGIELRVGDAIDIMAQVV